LVGVAVKVTNVPAQTGFSEAAMDTLTGRFVLTVIVTRLDVAGLPAAQERLEVNTTYTWSPVTGT